MTGGRCSKPCRQRGGIIPELLRGGRGYLFTQGSLPGLQAGPHAALADSQGQRRTATLARQHVLESLSLDAVASSRIGCAFRTQVEPRVSS